MSDEPKSPWVPVWEELPPEGEIVFCKIQGDDRNGNTYFLIRRGDAWEKVTAPTHWYRP